MNWLMEKLFGKEEPRVYVNAYQRTPEQEAMHRQQMAIQAMLGMEQGDSHQNWLRLHQILINHEERLTALETKK